MNNMTKEQEEKVRARIELVKSRYPKESNIQGFEPALSSDIMEIVNKALDEKCMEIADNLGIPRSPTRIDPTGRRIGYLGAMGQQKWAIPEDEVLEALTIEDKKENI